MMEVCNYHQWRNCPNNAGWSIRNRNIPATDHCGNCRWVPRTNRCTPQPQPILLTHHHKWFRSAQVPIFDCSGGALGAITVYVSGATSPYKYSGSQANSSRISQDKLVKLAPDTYNLLLLISIPCSVTASSSGTQGRHSPSLHHLQIVLQCEITALQL